MIIKPFKISEIVNNNSKKGENFWFMIYIDNKNSEIIKNKHEIEMQVVQKSKLSLFLYVISTNKYCYNLMDSLYVLGKYLGVCTFDVAQYKGCFLILMQFWRNAKLMKEIIPLFKY